MTKNTNTDTIRAAMIAAKKSVDLAAKVWRDADNTRRLAGVQAATATHEAVTSGYLHTGRLGKGESIPTGAVDLTGYADLFGVSKSLISMWRNAGAAYALGISPESTEGRALINGAATKSEVTAVLKGTRPSAAKIRTAVKAATGGDKSGKAPAKSAPVKAGTEAETVYTTGRNNTVRMDRAETELAALKGMTKTEKARLAGILTAFAETIGLVLVPDTEENAA